MKHLILAILALCLIVPASVVAADEPAISRAVFCTGLTDHEPADDLSSIPYGTKSVYFFTEVLNAADSNITHIWTYNDIEIARVTLKIGANRWRTWSSKQIWHLTPGVIKVQVVDDANMVLAEKTLTITNKE